MDLEPEPTADLCPPWTLSKCLLSCPFQIGSCLTMSVSVCTSETVGILVELDDEVIIMIKPFHLNQRGPVIPSLKFWMSSVSSLNELQVSYVDAPTAPHSCLLSLFHVSKIFEYLIVCLTCAAPPSLPSPPAHVNLPWSALPSMAWLTL